MKHRFGPTFVMGLLALSSSLSHAEDHSEYVQTKLVEGIGSVAAIGVGKRVNRDLTDQRTDLMHRLEANEHSLKQMQTSDAAFTDWQLPRNPEWKRLRNKADSVSAQIIKDQDSLRFMSSAEYSEEAKKLKSEISRLNVELGSVKQQLSALTLRSNEIARYVTSGKGGLKLTEMERNDVKEYSALRKSVIKENTGLLKKAVLTQLKEIVVSAVSAVPAVLLMGSLHQDYVSVSKKMEKAQTDSQTGQDSKDGKVESHRSVGQIAQ